MKAVLDENLSPALAGALNCLAKIDENEVFHILDLVPKGTTDVELFKVIAEQGIKIHITQDHHYRKQIERNAIANAGLIVFVLGKGWTSQSFFEKASRLVLWWPRIIEQAELVNPPFVYRVPWKKQGKGKFDPVRNIR